MFDQFIMGAIGMGLAVAALFFLRFWRESRDRFFAWFALAFFVLAVNRAMLGLFGESSETSLAPYLVRLLAFLIIIWAIVEKNVRRT